MAAQTRTRKTRCANAGTPACADGSWLGKRKYGPSCAKTAPMRTLAREGGWSTLTPAKPVVAKKAARTRKPASVAPKAQRVSGKQVASSKLLAQAAAQVKAGQLTVEGYAALASVLAA